MGALRDVDDGVLWRIVGALGLGEWQPLSLTCRAWRDSVLDFLRGLQELDLSSSGRPNLRCVACACPNLRELYLSTLLIRSDSLLCAPQHLSKLQALHLRECPLLTDAGLNAIFELSDLRSLDVSWASEFSDAPWSLAPAALREFRGLGCEHLTERVVVHLASRCPRLEVLHSSRHLNWIGATRPELVAALKTMVGLRDLSFQDIPLDDELMYALACLPLLARLELWSYNSEQYITDAGFTFLVETVGQSMTKISLDTFVFRGAGVLAALSSTCEALQELLLEGTAPCTIGDVTGVRLPSTLVKLRLVTCGLVGSMDCSHVQGLRYLWLFDNPGLETIISGGQQLKTLNLGSTRCRRLENFDFCHVDLLDLSSIWLAERALELIVLSMPLLTRAVLGNNTLPSSLLIALLNNARCLKNLSLCGVGDRTGLSSLAQQLSETLPGAFAPSLELLEIAEGSCALLADWISVEQATTVLRRIGKEVRLWMVEHGEHASPYGRLGGADDSWLPGA
mmetsp:Transcript_14413/g.32809  ORF Transcript_14413/g.32809 Transcript_14413/m.32809 type:complete len:510 (+) Transcript_14413:39-1568(+)